MLARSVFLLLVALNIAAALWVWLAPRPASSAPAATDPGVAVLTLLGESLARLDSDAAELAAAPEPSVPISSLACIEIGPFQTQSSLRQAQESLVVAGRPLTSREGVERRFRGFWVYLPATGSREAALSTARDLAAAGVRDYYVVTAGDQENTISLGLFRDRANAERRQQEMQSRGYPASLLERTEEQRMYWLTLAQVDTPEADWRGLVAAPNELQAAPVACPDVPKTSG